MMAITCILVFIQYWMLPVLFKYVDRYIIVITNVLMTVGLVTLYRINPDLAVKQLIWMSAGLGTMIIVVWAIARLRFLENFAVLFMILGLAMIAINFVFASEQGGALSYIHFENFSIQPSEIAKITLVMALACVFREKRNLRGYLLILGFICLSMVMLVIQTDLGSVLLYFLTTVVVIFAATSRVSWVGASVLAGGLGSVAAYHMFSHVRARVSIWIDPWLTPNTTGYQIVQGLIAIASGGLFGVGLGLGSPSLIPARQNDYIYAVICEEFGLIVGIILIAFYFLLTIRGLMIAMHAEDSYHGLLALAATVMLAVQSFIIIGGVAKFIPLTGITMPLVSYGGSSMVVTMVLIGIIQSVAHINGENRRMAYDDEQDDYLDLEEDIGEEET